MDKLKLDNIRFRTEYYAQGKSTRLVILIFTILFFVLIGTYQVTVLMKTDWFFLKAIFVVFAVEWTVRKMYSICLKEFLNYLYRTAERKLPAESDKQDQYRDTKFGGILRGVVPMPSGMPSFVWYVCFAIIFVAALSFTINARESGNDAAIAAKVATEKAKIEAKFSSELADIEAEREIEQRKIEATANEATAKMIDQKRRTIKNILSKKILSIADNERINTIKAEIADLQNRSEAGTKLADNDAKYQKKISAKNADKLLEISNLEHKFAGKKTAEDNTTKLFVVFMEIAFCIFLYYLELFNVLSGKKLSNDPFEIAVVFVLNFFKNRKKAQEETILADAVNVPNKPEIETQETILEKESQIVEKYERLEVQSKIADFVDEDLQTYCENGFSKIKYAITVLRAGKSARFEEIRVKFEQQGVLIVLQEDSCYPNFWVLKDKKPNNNKESRVVPIRKMQIVK